MRGAMVTVKCQHCKEPFQARVADRKRGWGKFCSKSCKAKKQEQRTHQHTNYLHGKRVRHYQNEYGGTPQFDNNGNYVGFTMSPAELACGGYGDADEHSPFGEGKWD